MTLTRRGSQNSSATMDRLDHSAPIQVAPMTKASAAVATATAVAPVSPSSPRTNGRLSMNCSTPPKLSAVGGVPQDDSTDWPSGTSVDATHWS